MKITGDYHTHTKYSKFLHGKNTLEEMVEAAEKAGLKEIAITDHGFYHFFGITKKNLKKLRAQIDELNKTSKVKVLLGMECNLLGLRGQTDLKESAKPLLDIRLFGFHRALVGGWWSYIKLLFSNIFLSKEKAIERNTDAYINAIKSGDFDIITHPQEYIKVNIKKLAEAAAEHNTYIEINNRHCVFSKQDIYDMLDTKVMFLLNSDAHSVGRVGVVDKSVKLASDCNIPISRIANVGKIPKFKSHR